MEITPLRNYPQPEYPTATAFHQNGLQLMRHIPRRWRFAKTLGSVLAFTILSGLCACSLQNSEKNTDTEKAISESVPLFVHGNGRGSYGCVSIAPPVFLSEDEAAQVIRETAEEYGLSFTKKGTVAGDALPYTSLYEEMEDTYKGELPLDGYDASTGLGYLFVSRDDIVSWHKDTGVYASVEFFDTKGTAEKLAATVKNTAVFYDPGTDSDLRDRYFKDAENPYIEENLAAYMAAQKTQAEEKLRAQVMDFIAWLQAQGIL